LILRTPRHLIYQPFLRRRLQEFHPKQAGISEKRFQNIRADVTFAIARFASAPGAMLAGNSGGLENPVCSAGAGGGLIPE